MNKYNTIDPKDDICCGMPRITGTRLTVYNVVSSVHDSGLAEFIKNWDYVSLEAIDEAVDYCRSRHCEKDNSTQFCDGCSLRADDDDDFDQYLKEWGTPKMPGDIEAYRSYMN